MPDSFRIRITETTTTTGSAELTVASESAELAAAQMLVAYQTAKAAGTTILVLPGGQREVLERETTVSAAVRFDLLDADRAIVREIAASSVRRSLT